MMRKKFFLFLYVMILMISGNSFYVYGASTVLKPETTYTVPTYHTSQGTALHAEPKQKRAEKTIPFYFEDVPLQEIIDEYARVRGMNIVLPQGTQAITQKITFKRTKNKIPLSEAYQYLVMFLDLCGYSIVPINGFYQIVKNDTPGYARNPLPLYINVPPADLPKSDEKIRAVYYLANLRVPDPGVPDNNNPIYLILKDMIGDPNKPGSGGSFILDSRSNGIILNERANNIASIMTIILELDAYGTSEVLEVLPLYNTQASFVAKIVEDQLKIITPPTSGGPVRTDVRSDSERYFSPNIRVVADPRTNSLILIGRDSGVSRLREYIQEYIDVPLDSGKSILHVYDLQYLDAEAFSKVLQEIVKPRKSGAAGQSSSDSDKMPGDFDNVVVAYDVPKSKEGTTTKKSGEEISGGYIGGNRLVISAKNRDWERIKKLIFDLDRPERQVIIEVLIVDVALSDRRQIAGQTRLPSGVPFPDSMEFQSAQMTNIITKEVATTIDSDLLEKLPGSTTSIANQITQVGFDNGATIVSFNDPNGSGIWGLLEVLQAANDTKIIAHPFLVTQSNMPAIAKSCEERIIQGDATSSGTVALNVPQVTVSADLTVQITPRVSSLERVSMTVSVDIGNFKPGASTDTTGNARTTRKVVTQAHLNSGEVLVLGGLTQVQDTSSRRETPILGQIPIIGWLFRRNDTTIVRSNLAVFICPTVVEPKLRKGLHEYTCSKVKIIRGDTDDSSLFDSLEDPITRFFFKGISDIDTEMVDEYLSEGNIDSYAGRGSCALPAKGNGKHDDPPCSPCAPRSKRKRSVSDQLVYKSPPSSGTTPGEQVADTKFTAPDELVIEDTNEKK